MTALVKYEAARAALQAAHKVDEVKDIRDKAQAMALYAKQAQDTELVAWATEIKVRAERRAGEMLAAMKVNGARHDAVDNLKTGEKQSPKSHDTTSGPTLDSIGISKDQSSRWQKLAAIPEERFEKAVAEAKGTDGEVTTASLLRAMKPKARPRAAAPEPAEKPKADDGNLRAELIDLQGRFADLLEKHKDLADTAREVSDKLVVFETTDPDEQQKMIASLQKKVVRLEGEIDRLKIARNDCQNKNNELVREVKRLKRKAGE